MTARTRAPASSARRDLSAWSTGRRAYLDNLKVLLIAGIIVIHAVLGYASTLEAWTYTEYRESSLATPVELVLFAVVAPFGFFLIALLFLVAGLLTPQSWDRKGGRRFVVDRLLRLGIPFLVYVLVVQPTLKYFLLVRPLHDGAGSYWDEYLGFEGNLDTGPLWFVGVLLVFSLGYAAWVRLRRPPVTPAPITTRTLLVAAVLVAPLSFAVRLIWPYASEAGFTDLNYWQWPVCLAMFALGVRAGRLGWTGAVPPDLVRRAGWLTSTAVVAMTGLMVLAGSLDVLDEARGGWHWAAAAFAVVEGVLTVFGSVWLLSVAQRRLDVRHRWTPVLGRSAYGAFMLQTVFLLSFAVALRPVGVPAEAKAVVVAAASVWCSFALSWLLIRRVPGMSRVL